MGWPHLDVFIVVSVPLPKQVSQSSFCGIVVSIVFAPKVRESDDSDQGMTWESQQRTGLPPEFVFLEIAGRGLAKSAGGSCYLVSFEAAVSVMLLRSRSRPAPR